MSKLIDRECPNCGASIKIDSELQIIKCEYCNTEFELPASIYAKTDNGETAFINATSDGNFKMAQMLHKSELNKKLRIVVPLGCFSLLGTLGVIVFIIIFFVRSCG